MMRKKLLLSILTLALLLASCGQPSASPTPTEVAPEPMPTEVAPEPTPTEVAPEPTPTEVVPEPTATQVAPEPTATAAPTQEPTAVEGGVITSEAMVEGIEILLLESFPIQVHVVAQGNLPDSCTEIAEVTEERDGDTFRVTITTSRPADAMCAAVLIPFEEVIALDVVGLPAGVYTVNVNGVSDTFEFTVDNVMAGPPVEPRQEYVPTLVQKSCWML